MKAFLILCVFSFLTHMAHSSTLEKAYETEFESLNQEIKHELLYGNLASPSLQKSLQLRIKKLGSLALEQGGLKHKLMITMTLKKTVKALTSLNSNYREALDVVYANGLTGREIIIEALDPENNRKIVEIYNQKKESLRSTLSGRNLKIKAMDLTMAEVEHNQEFAFLNMEPVENYVLKDNVFSFIKEKCVPKFGEENFHLLVFGYNRCLTDKYRVDRYTIGPGFYNADSGYTWVTGLKIGKKSFRGIGVRIQAGIKLGYGIGVFIGNGLMLSLDLEKTAYGLYAGATYFVLIAK
jgi:hypothetical protein